MTSGCTCVIFLLSDVQEKKQGHNNSDYISPLLVRPTHHMHVCNFTACVMYISLSIQSYIRVHIQVRTSVLCTYNTYVYRDTYMYLHMYLCATHFTLTFHNRRTCPQQDRRWSVKKRRSSQSVGRKMWCQSTMHYLHCTCMYAVCVPVEMYPWSLVHAYSYTGI